MLSPDSRANLARCQAEAPLIALCRFPKPALRKPHQLWVVTTRADKPWLITFSTSNDGKTLSFAEASIEFMNTVADAHSVEFIDENKQLLTSVDMKDSAAAIRAILN